MAFADRAYAIYDAAVERPAVARVVGRLIWGADTGVFYGAHAEVASVAPGTTVLDVPCGGGVAFRHFPRQAARYVAVDLEQRMLDRARAEAQRLGLGDRIEFVQADVTRLPLGDGEADLCLSSAGLHCFPDPAGAIAEMARCLKPGGRLVATMAVRGAGARQDALIAFSRRTGIFAQGGTAADLESWARDAGLQDVQLQRSGAIARLDARRPAA
jgi:ubiquinone/menaquinone biosynthesis C-methylase UbiE